MFKLNKFSKLPKIKDWGGFVTEKSYLYQINQDYVSANPSGLRLFRQCVDDERDVMGKSCNLFPVYLGVTMMQ